MSSKFLKDDYFERFDEWSALQDSLRDLDSTGEWIDQFQLKELMILPLSDPEVQLEVGPEEYEDTQQHSNLAIRFPNGRVLCVRSQGVNSLHSRAGVTGAAYQMLSPEIEAQHLNDGLSVMGNKRAVVRIEGGKILAVHSSDYNPFAIPTGMAEAREFFELKYPDAKFSSGYMDHNQCTAIMDLSEYNDLFFNELRDFFGAEITPKLGVCMGDSAQECVTLWPKVLVDKEGVCIDVPLGTELKIKHRGKKDIMAKFRANLETLNVQFEQPMRIFRKMKEVILLHPVDTFMNASEKIGLNKQCLRAINMMAEDFEFEVFNKEASGEPINALDVYLCMCRIPEKAADLVKKPETEIRVREIIKRALDLNWTTLDYRRM